MTDLHLDFIGPGAEIALRAAARAEAAADEAAIERGLAEDAAASSATQSRLLAPRLLVVGDSIVQQNHFGGPSSMETSSAGEIIWAQGKHPYFTFETWRDTSTVTDLQGMNQGVAGETTAQVRARFLDALAMSPDAVLITAGGNSVSAEVAAATIAADLQWMCDQALAAGAKVILANIRPRDASQWPDGSNKMTIFLALNDLIDDIAENTPGVQLWDVFSVYSDGASPPRPLADYTSDGTHPSRTGAKAAGDALVPILKRLFKPIYEIKPAGTNLVTNGTMSGTGGTLGTGVSGTGPTSWSTARAIGDAAIVGGKNGDGYQTFAISPGGTGGTNDAMLVSRLANEAVTPGEWVQGFARFSLSDWAGWREVTFLFNFASGTTYSVTALGVHANDYVLPVTGTEEFLVVTPLHEILPGNTLLNTVVRVFFDGTDSDTGTLTIREVGMKYVADPQPYYNL